MEKKIKRTVLLALIAILCGQINISFYLSDFRISVAIIFILLVCFVMRSFYLLPMVLLSGAGIVGSRILLAYFLHDEPVLLMTYLPELAFYTCYALLLALYMRFLYARLSGHQLMAYLPLVLIDYLSNFCELLIRAGNDAFTFKGQGGILLIALARTFIFWCILQLFLHYHSLLLHQEEADRYKQLVIFISRLNEELVWLRKDTELIESTMTTAYQLYDRLQQYPAADKELSSMALDISRGVHEIKKEYLLILQGLSRVLEGEDAEHDSRMQLLDMLYLVRDSVVRLAAESGITMTVQIDCTDNFLTTKPYLLLSVFRNLLINSMEAARDGKVTIRISQRIMEDDYFFSFADNGTGIPDEAMRNIFQPGFSTKINYETGEINRGLGLSLMQDMIEKDFGGEITVESSKKGTTFFFTLKIEEV